MAKSYRRRQVLGSIAAVLCVAIVFAQEKPLDNVEIVRLTKLDMGDEIIIAKIRSAKEVKFDTSTDDLVKLREQDVSKAVIVVMLERLTPAVPTAVPAASAVSPVVTLYANGGSLPLTAEDGVRRAQEKGLRQLTFRDSRQTWVHFSGERAKVRTTDRRPSFLVVGDKDPRGTLWLVMLYVREDESGPQRRFRLEDSSGQTCGPNSGYVVKYDVVQEQPNHWRITVPEDLDYDTPEFGLFSCRGKDESILFGFGIDEIRK